MIRNDKDRETIGWAVLFCVSVFMVSYFLYNLPPSNSQDKLKLLQFQHAQVQFDHKHLKRIHSLSIEFGFDPLLVMAVDDLSKRYVDRSKLRYRLLTKNFMTYLFLGLIWVESKGVSSAIGDKGKSFGLTQLQIPTAKRYDKAVTKRKLLTIEGNLEIAFAHTDYLLKKYRGNIARWLHGWNRGEGKVDRLLSIGLPTENGYAVRVYKAAELNNRGLVVE